MTAAVPKSAGADFAPVRMAEAGSQPSGADGLDFARVLSGLAENPNPGGNGEAETGTPASPEAKAAEETATVPDALTLASLAQLWLPTTPPPVLPPTSAVGSESVAAEADGLPTAPGTQGLQSPGGVNLPAGRHDSSSAAVRDSVSGVWPTGGSLLPDDALGDGAPSPVSTGLMAKATEVPGFTRVNPTAALSAVAQPTGVETTVGHETAAPLRPFAPLGSLGSGEPPPLGLPGASAFAAAMSSQPISAEIPSAPTPSPLARRFASAAEMMFTSLTDAVDQAAGDTRVPGAGTGTAEQGDTMKEGSDQKQFAESGEPALPLELASAPAVSRGGARMPTEVRGLTDLHVNEPSVFSSLLPLSSAGYFGVEDLRDMPALGAVAARPVVELTQAGLMQHVTELRYSGATEMAVVLKPDADTQLALRLTFNSHGEVAVQARCEQGDVQMLAANWGEIRHSLAQQGVRLGALEFTAPRTPDNLHPQAGNGGPSPDGQPSSQRHGQPWPETLDDLPLAGSLTEPPGRRGVQRGPANRNRLLESWA